MQMHIRHETRYRYERPVKYSVQSLHLTPRRDLSQRALTWSISAPGRRLEQVDAYGNISHLLTIEEPHREIQIVVHGVVETADTEGRQDDGTLSPLAYLAPTHLTAPNDELKAFAQSALNTVKEPRARAQALADAVFGAVRYKSGTSDVADSAAVAFKSGEGVCQDHAHVYIASARSVGIPTRYVSGYLFTGDTNDAASHAWVDVWLGAEIGWRSIDVTHKRPAVRTYCRLAVGRDYLDAAPVRGVRQGGGGEKMEANVLVAESLYSNNNSSDVEFAMTYCVGLLVDTGLVMLSDSRTNAGVDQINTFRKMATFQRANDRVLVLLSAGNLAITQAVVNLLHEAPEDASLPSRIFRASNMFNAARVVGDALREIYTRDAKALEELGHEFNGTFILGGQIKGEEPRMFHIYSAGNFIESSVDTPYFQIGESKYGKPIIDRVMSRSSSLAHAAKCALVSMDSTIRSNLSVGPPLDLAIIRRDEFKLATHISIDLDNEYFKMIRTRWGYALREVFSELPNPNW